MIFKVFPIYSDFPDLVSDNYKIVKQILLSQSGVLTLT